MSMRYPSVLVIGGSGFIGAHIVARLAASSHRVIVPTRRLPRARHLLVLPTVQIVEADIYDEATLNRLIGQVDAVINLLTLALDLDIGKVSELERLSLSACGEGG